MASAGLNITYREEQHECDGTVIDSVTGEESPCDFEDLVAVSYEHGTGYWECPDCGQEHLV